MSRLSNFNLSALASALSNRDMTQASEIQGNIKQDVVECCLLKTTVRILFLLAVVFF